MVSFVIGGAVCAAVLALLCRCAAAGFRNGDQAADAEVSAVLRHSGQPDESRPVVVATVRNPSGPRSSRACRPAGRASRYGSAAASTSPSRA